MNCRKILLPLTRTDNQTLVFSQALQMAKQERSHLKLFHCICPEVYSTPHGLFTTSQLSLFFPKWQQELKEEQIIVRQWLSTYQQQATVQGISSEIDWAVEPPSVAIVEMAKKWEADLIVMGRRGLCGLSEMLLGSVSNSVVHHAPCSVLLVQ